MNTPDFDPEEFLNRPINPNHIEGIYNYCDRWCERCTMGKHCTNYETNMRFSSANQDLDKKNEEFWQELGQIWENTAKLIHHVAEKQGIDLNALIQTEEVLKDAEERKDRHKKVMKHPMVRQAFKYTDLTDAILFK